MLQLGVNIDHVATLRQARGESFPDPLQAADLCLKSDAHSIVAHLREDRRHIQDHDVVLLRKLVKKRFNLELSLNPQIVLFALSVQPDQVTFVPERRQEITTEGGLNLKKSLSKLKKIIPQFRLKKIIVSLFVDPNEEQIRLAHQLNVPAIELHTGTYAAAKTKRHQKEEWKKLNAMTQLARAQGLIVNAGHGLNYENTQAIAAIEGLNELNIGHSIISRAVFVGLARAVQDMLKILNPTSYDYRNRN